MTGKVSIGKYTLGFQDRYLVLKTGPELVYCRYFPNLDDRCALYQFIEKMEESELERFLDKEVG